MNFDPVGAQLGVRSAYTLSHSALPDAPVVAHRECRKPVATSRLRAAHMLRHLARWVEPAERPIYRSV
jgi:hypothetical protein